MSYSSQEINEFQQRDKRIMFQSIFSSLCNYYGLKQCELRYDEIMKDAYEILEDLIRVYPMMVIDEHIKNQSQGMPF